MKIPRITINGIGDVDQQLQVLMDLIETAEPYKLFGDIGQPAFQNGWGNFAGRAGFRKNILGQIELKGEITSPAFPLQGNGTVAFTLPSGYFDPTFNIRVVGVGTSGLAAPVVATIDIGTNGAVTITLSGVAANAVVTRVTLNGIVYRIPNF